MISLIGNRPALQVGRHQVIDYDTAWLQDALKRAAEAANQEDFPFLDDIHNGVVEYLETKCPLKLLELESLFERVRRMLVMVGCEGIADKLEPQAPPVTVSLVEAARRAGNGFELAFFESLRAELLELKQAGVRDIHFTGLRESSLILRGCEKWNKRCEALLEEIETFLQGWEREASPCGA